MFLLAQVSYKETDLPRFVWARGYAALTLFRDAVTSVTRYISMQKSHHNRVPFDKESAVLATRLARELERNR